VLIGIIVAEPVLVRPDLTTQLIQLGPYALQLRGHLHLLHPEFLKTPPELLTLVDHPLVFLLGLLQIPSRRVMLPAPFPGRTSQGEEKLRRARFEGQCLVVLGGHVLDPLLGGPLRLGVRQHLGLDSRKLRLNHRRAVLEDAFPLDQVALGQHRLAGVEPGLDEFGHLLLSLLEFVPGHPPAPVGRLAVAPVPQLAQHPDRGGLPGVRVCCV